MTVGCCQDASRTNCCGLYPPLCCTRHRVALHRVCVHACVCVDTGLAGGSVSRHQRAPLATASLFMCIAWYALIVSDNLRIVRSTCGVSVGTAGFFQQASYTVQHQQQQYQQLYKAKYTKAESSTLRTAGRQQKIRLPSTLFAYINAVAARATTTGGILAL